MNRGYVLTPLAESDLDDIWDYVAERFGFDLADGVLESLHRAFRLLAENPEIGHIREDIAPPPYSFWPVGPSLIALRPDDGRMDWPTRGAYFFFETGEVRTDSGNGPRVVRVGTHALTARSRTTLWNRLSNHRGTVATGGGNHRGSIFRLLVGTALMDRDPACAVDTWGHGDSAAGSVRDAERALERRVSGVIGAMPLLWLRIDDPPGPASRRGYIERNAIGLLSDFDRAPYDPPSRGWLGSHSNRPKVRQSGLWNQQHVEESYDPAFLEVLDRLVTEQLTAANER